MRTLVPIIACVAILGGCAAGPAWQRQTYAFAVPDDPPSANARTNTVALGRLSISPLFQSRSFTYRTADDTYEQDPYAGFLIAPERALAVPVRRWLGEAGAFGRILEPESGLTPSIVVEASVNELYGDFRNPSRPVGRMEIHFIIYENKEDGPGPVVLDRICTRQTPLARKTPSALMAAWDADLRQIMEEINSEYAKANSPDR